MHTRFINIMVCNWPIMDSPANLLSAYHIILVISTNFELQAIMIKYLQSKYSRIRVRLTTHTFWKFASLLQSHSVHFSITSLVSFYRRISAIMCQNIIEKVERTRHLQRKLMIPRRKEKPNAYVYNLDDQKIEIYPERFAVSIPPREVKNFCSIQLYLTDEFRTRTIYIWL